jgi:hypothetical protein
LGGSQREDIALQGDRDWKVEVKGTGIRAWNSFGGRDRVADYLIWIDFTSLESGGEPFVLPVHVFTRPGEYASSSTEGGIHLRSLMKLSKGRVETTRFSIGCLK